MKHLVKILSLGAALVASVSVASATPIAGSFSITSDSGSYVGGTASTATGLDFGILGTGAGNGYGTNGTATVSNAFGSFSSLNNTTASIADIALGTSVASANSNPFISFGNNSSIIVSILSASVLRFPTGVNVSGTASFTDGIAADATTGTFSLTTSSQGGSPGNMNFTFTGNQGVITAATPEPSSLVMLGTGLMSAAGMLVRRRRIS